MANELFDIDPLEVSLVDRGANKRRILVRKRDDEGDTMGIEKMALSEDQLGAVAAVLGELGGGDAATDDQRAAAAEILGTVIELGGLYPAPEEAAEEVAAAESDDEPEEVEAAEHEDEPEEVAAAEHEDDDEDEDKDKGAITMAKRKFAKVAAELVAVRKALQVETDRRLVAEHVQKCADWPNLFAAAAAGPILKSIHDKLDAAEYGFVEQCLTESQEFAKAAGLFGEVGTTGAPDEVGDPGAQLNAIAKRYHDDGKAATFAKAYTLAMDAFPHLVTEIHSTQYQGK
jgi:hypothetical protein